MFGGPGCFAGHVLLLLIEAASTSVLTSCFCFFFYVFVIDSKSVFVSFFFFFLFPHKFVIFAELLGSFSWGVEIGFGLHAKAFLLRYFLYRLSFILWLCNNFIACAQTVNPLFTMTDSLLVCVHVVL